MTWVDDMNGNGYQDGFNYGLKKIVPYLYFLVGIFIVLLTISLISLSR